MAGPPSVTREGGEADVSMRIHGDRSRLQAQVIAALAAAESGLRSNPATPAQTSIEVSALVPMRGSETRRFRSIGNPVGLYLDGQLAPGQLWQTYVQEIKNQKDAQVLAFNAADASGRSAEPASDADAADAINMLAANFGPLGVCARTEATKNRRFAGVTLHLRWLPSGQIDNAVTKEKAMHGGELERCLARAAAGIRLPRFSGAPRAVDFPIRVQKPR
jgi:hypothetical protein